MPPRGDSVKLLSALSPTLHEIAQPLKRRILECRAAAAAPGLATRIAIEDRPLARPEDHSVIVIQKAGGRIRSIEAHAAWLTSRNGFSTTWRRLPAIVNVVGDASVADGAWTADLADWVHPAGPVIGFCSNHHDSLLVPDRGFHASAGYAREQRRAAAAPRFEDRDPEILWRGSPTGQGNSFADPMEADNPHLIQRVRMCLRVRDMPPSASHRIDVRIAVTERTPRGQAEAYRRAGIAGGHVPQASWCRRRHAIDVDGFANAFSNFFVRLLYGCCVIKVASPRGFRQWYYDRLEPWHHFVPVAADLSDMPEALAWCQANPRQCRDIAAAGQQVALAMTRAAERTRAVQALAARPFPRSRGVAGDRPAHLHALAKRPVPSYPAAHAG